MPFRFGGDAVHVYLTINISPYAVDDLGFTIVADGVESASAGTNTGRHSNE